MLNHKTIFKQKSKILLVFICIFGLILYYGCGRDDDGGITDPSSFSISEATGNVKTSIVQSSKTIGGLKIGFAASHDYTMDYTVEDSETDETKKLTKTDFTKSTDNVLTLNNDGLGKVRAWNTDNGPAEKTITINFTFKANDASLKNNTQNLSVEVKLTHAQKFTDQTFANTVDKFQSVNYVDPNSDQNDPDVASFSFTSFQSGTLTLRQQNNTAAISINKTEMKEKVIRRLNSSEGIKSAKEVAGDTITGGNSSSESIKFKVELEFTDNYESGAVTNPITVEVFILQAGSWVD